jgi:hypothetical protein
LKFPLFGRAHRIAIRGHGNAFRVKPGEAVANSDEWLFGDGINGVGSSYSSFVPSRFSEKMCYFITTYKNAPPGSTGQVRIQNLHPHICCATHND